jgi:hypothetical protein
MASNRDSDALAALMVLAAQLRDTASAVAQRADEAASGITKPNISAEDAWNSADFGAIADFVRLLREAVPPELRDRLEGSSREALLALRALIDWYLSRDIPEAVADDSDPAS